MTATAGQRITATELNATVCQLTTGNISSSAAEAVIGTFTVPAGDAQAGAGYRWQIFGNADDTGTPTLTLKMRINGVAGDQIGNVFSAITCRTTTTGMTWAIDGWLYFSAVGASATANGHITLDEVLASGTPTLHGGPTFSGAPTTFDTTAAWTIVVTAQWSASSASNIARTLGGSLGRIGFTT